MSSSTENTTTTSVNGLFYLIGTILGAVIGGVTQETLTATVIGAIIGLLFATFFVKVLLNGRSHDR